MYICIYLYWSEIAFLLIKILHKVLNVIIADIVLGVCMYLYICMYVYVCVCVYILY